MTKISIRKATIEDKKTLLEFEQGVIEAERPLDDFLKSGTIFYYNLDALITSENIHFLVATVDDKPVGTGYVRIENSAHYHKNPLIGYVGFIYVKPALRGQKISEKVISNLKDWASQKGIKELRLDVYHNNKPALKSYENFGFKKSLINMRMEI